MTVQNFTGSFNRFIGPDEQKALIQKLFDREPPAWCNPGLIENWRRQQPLQIKDFESVSNLRTKFSDKMTIGLIDYSGSSGGGIIGQIPRNLEQEDKLPSLVREVYGDGNCLYEGQRLDEREHGYGRMLFDDGMSFVGEFKNGEKNGHGSWFRADGTPCQAGVYKDDELVEEDKKEE